MNKSILGIGSVGLSTMYFLSKNTQLPSSSFLFVKSNFEGNLEEEATKSISSRKKYDSLLAMKKLGILRAFDDVPLVGNNNDNNAPSSSEHQELFSIAGLGGESGDFFLKIAESINTKSGPSLSFCIMPFTFEGTKRTEIAKYQLEKIREISEETIVLKNQDLLKNTDQNKTFDEAFEEFHKLIKGKIFNN
jgi:hypothetical protein